ncbi:Atg2p [Sporobolomyces koalae]|uniref:Atg2p n=1 Tax=Sporobolomyces koalae TaxID=500713 RepID=UPI00317C339B
MPIPSLASLLAYLPNVSVPPLIPLPTNLQQRLIAYLLRKSLGGIIKGGLDSNRIEADIRDGSFGINQVEIDQQAIAPLLASTPTLAFVSGTISNVSAKVSYPLAQLSLALTEIEIVLRVESRAAADEWLRQSTDTLAPPSPALDRHDNTAQDLTESINSIAVAQDFIEHELSPGEDAELRASLHLAPSIASSDLLLPGAFGGASRAATAGNEDGKEAEEVETTMLAGLIERILARLHVKVSRVNVRLLWSEDEETEEENEIAIKIDEVEYIGDANSVEQTKQHATPLREVKVSPPQVLLRLAQSPSYSSSASSAPSSSGSSTSASTDEIAQSVSLSTISLPPTTHYGKQGSPVSSETGESQSESDSESSGDENDLLAMSQSIADLRTSTASLAESRTSRKEGRDRQNIPQPVMGSIQESAGSEMFSSATSFVSARSVHTKLPSEGPNAAEEHNSSPFHNPDSPPARPAPSQSKPNPLRPVIAFGGLAAAEPLRFYLSTVAVGQPGSSGQSRLKPTLRLASTLPAGWIAAFTTTELAALLRLVQLIDTMSEKSTSTESRSASAAPISIDILLKSITVILAYPDTRAEDLFSALWSSKDPSSLPSAVIKAPHLRLRLDAITLAVQDGSTTLNVRHLTLCEALSDDQAEKQAWKMLPILVSDHGLMREGSADSGGDWISEGAQLTKDWRIKVPSTPSSLGSGGTRRKTTPQEEDEQAGCPAIGFELTKDETISFRLSPFHLFVDLTILSRLSEVVATLTEAVKITGDGAATPTPLKHRASSSAQTKHVGPVASEHERQGFLPSPSQPETPKLQLLCPLLRIELRCPAPKSLRAEKRQANLLRGGIVVVDLAALCTEYHNESFVARFSELRAGIRKADGTRKVDGILSVSSLSPSDPAAVMPVTAFQPALPGSNPNLRLALPLVHVKLDKRGLDSLQLFADDLSQFLSAELSASSSYGGSSMGHNREKLIGSRYFGTKSFRGSARFGSASKGDASEYEGEGSGNGRDEGTIKLQLELDVTDFVVDLLLPVVQASQATAKTSHLRLLASDISLAVTTHEHAADDLRARAQIGDVKVEEFGTASDSTKKILLARTMQRDITSIAVEPLVKIAFAASADPQTDLKDSKIEIGIDGITYHSEIGHLYLAQSLQEFVKAPEGAFEQVVPNELTRLRVRLSNVSLQATPPNLPSRVVLTVNESTIKTDLMPDLPRTSWTVEVKGAKVWAVESAGDLKQAETRGSRSTSLFWKSKGFAQLAELEKASIVARQGNGLVLPDSELLVSNANVRLALCADSIAALTLFADEILSDPALQSSTQTQPSRDSQSMRASATEKQSTMDLFASVDDNAFERAPSIHDYPEFLGDDVPVNADYLARTLSQRSKQSSSSTFASSTATRTPTSRVIENIEGETVRMLSAKGLQIENDWLAESKRRDQDHTAPASRIRLRLTNTNLSVQLHEGYDWLTTRKTIEEEARAVRRRLEKIRQLLASGQTPDASAENASVLMFGSHQLGLPPGANEMTPKDLLAAIDEELNQDPADEGDSASTAASSWQTFPGGRSRSEAGPGKPASTAVGRGRKRLTRSKACAIEINVRGLNANFDSFSTDSPSITPATVASSDAPRLATKISVEVDSFDILDNIKTSTWRKFLTEMRAADGGLVRASGSPMVKLEIQTLKPARKGDSAQDEICMKIKIAPLRLYIDQDALDFLKAFGAFKGPPSAHATLKTASPPPEPFFQRVEVLPIKIKLDYKPKRVDYYALKQGKTAELMNFFHFDGSEMVLRHLIVTGVSGTTTLSNLVQDIWTPDVKANQLADVISGIAPVRSVVNVGSGVANLVLLPIEQYRKDGRVVRGLQKGAQAFAKQTTLEAINVGAKLANGTQVILEQAEHVLGAKFSHRVMADTVTSPEPTVGSSSEVGFDPDDISDEEEVNNKARSRYAEQPADLRQGVASAYKSLGENFKEAAQTVLAVPMEVYERSANEGPVRAVVRAVPIAVLRPMIGASGAVSKALLGLRNTLDPDQQQGELEDKYKPRPNS